ncbi:SDR family NAD(P)-dependent oxidoreductase [Amycolatopsis sp. lyj-346]|uniref:SDR family NAD(P)-dependent oxidoreductase n=1 Tax=Amycolatopsis sp. lyj-346 TaxID=2789289 RepID=UPI00397D87F5
MSEPLAVVGFACRYPGAPDADGFWRLLADGRDALTRFDDAELAARGVPEPLRRNPAYVPVGGLIDDQDRFDPAPFGLSGPEAELLDPQQRVFLETAWHALEHAGHAGGREAGVVGTFAGAALSAYLATNLAHRFDPLGGADPAGSLQLHTGNVADYLPLRTAHRFGFTGPAIAVGATCATSLVAVHVAAQSLLAGECDTALAGGVSLRVPQGRGYLHVPDGPFSADGVTRPYSADARGTVFTQGAGVVVLRRLADALASGDHVHAVLLGSAVANDGARRAGFTAPSAEGQARTIAEALAVAGVDPAEVSYVEGHGTGTVLGDPIEVQALRRVFGPAGAAWCGLGSVKGTIGHADSAAGIAGFLKTVLALAHRTIPASLHATPVNPALELDGSPFRIVTETEPWAADGPRRAGVSSFGIGGTNCHVVLGEAPAPVPAVRDERAQLIVVSAATAEACRATARALADGLSGDAAGDTADVAHTLALGRKEFPVRAAVSVAPGEDVAAALRAAPVASPRSRAPRIVFGFPGGGAQYAGMAAGLYRDEPVFAEAVDELAAFFPAEVRAVLLDPAHGAARDPGAGLPALFTASVAMARLLESWDVRPDVVLGHSVGEYAAAVVAGVLSGADAARLVAERSRLMTGLDGGGMLAVPLGEAEVHRLLARHPGLDLAAVNAEDACAVSGARADVERLRDELAADGVRTRWVGVDVAAHSRLVEPAMPALRAVTARLSPRPAELPLVTTLPGSDPADPEHWVRHLRGTVRFAEALDTACGDDAVLVQVGPGGMLASLAARRGPSVTTFPRQDEGGDGRAAALDALGRLWALGAGVSLAALHRPGRRRLPLPGYAFQRERYWVAPAPRVTDDASPREPLQLPVWRQLPPLPAAAPGVRVVGEGPWADALRAASGEGEPVAVVVAPPGGSGDETRRLADVVLAYRDLGDLPVLQLTRHGEAVIGTEDVDPVAAGVRGLPRVLGQETGVRWRTLDVTEVPDARAALAEVADLLSGESARELALRGGKRWLRQWEHWRPAPLGELPAAPVVVVTGGLGNVGRALARRLLDDGPAHVVLASRNPRPVPGVRVEAVDVTDAAAVAALLDRVIEEHGRIDLLVHAPVVVELATLSEVDDETVLRSLAPKVAGVVALRSAVEGRPVRTVLLMSSAAGTIGGFGLGAYVAASRFVDGFAHAMRGSAATWLAVDWDRWRFGTEAERASAAELTMRHALDSTDALDALLRLAAAAEPPAQVAVSPAELNSRSRALASRTVRASDGGAAVTNAAERLVAAVWSEALGQEVTSREDDFFALGGHSLLATRVLARLRDDHGITLRLRDLLARPTVAGLAELVSVAGEPLERPSGEVVRATGGPFPLTRVQHAYRVGRSAGYGLGEVACHFYLEHRAPGLDVERYERAWNRVIARHEMLRSVVTADGENLVLPEVPVYRVPVHDVTEAGLAELRERLSRRVADPGRWPLIEAHVARLPGGEQRVLLSVDVLVCDSASYLIVDRELRALYADPAAELPAPATTFADCVAALQRRQGSAEHRRAAEYWLARDLPDAPPLPVRPAGERPRFGRRRAVLPAGRWAGIRERAAAAGVTPTAVLLAAYSDVLARWSGSDHFCLTLTVFDRPAGHDGIVGEFSSLLLFETDRRGVAGFAARAAAAQARLFDDLDHSAFSGLEVLAEQARRTGRQRNVPVVFTGMLGLDRMGGEPHDTEWLGPVVHGVSQTPQVWLDHQAYERHGELILQWDVAETALDATEADHAFGEYVAWLEKLAETDWATAEPGDDDQAPATTPSAPRWPSVRSTHPRRPSVRSTHPRPHWGARADEMGDGRDEPDGRDGRDEPAGASAEADPIRQALAAIWGELLDLDPAGLAPDTSFLAAGGDSLLAVRMASFIRQRLTVVLGPAEIRAEATLTELAAVVRVRSADGPAPRALATRVRRRRDAGEPFGLLPLQQAYFVGQQGGWELSYDSAHVCTDVALSEVDAERAPAALADALRRVTAHQPMLRARILPDGTQRLHPDAEIRLDVVDLRDGGDLLAIRDRLGTHGPDPVTGPGLAMCLVLLPGGRGRLFTSFSLLVVDGWSAAVFERELLAYVADPNTVLPPLLVDFGDYATALAEIREGGEWAADRDWWWQRIDTLPAAPDVPLRTAPRDVSANLMAARESRLPEWEALRAECARRELTPTAVLLAAYAVALAKAAGQSRFLLNSLQANRLPLHPDVDRMIGAFSSTALLGIDLGDGGAFTALARGVHRELTESLAHNLVSGVEVAREVARRRGSTRPVAPFVFQSTLGMDAAVGGERPETAGPLGRIDVSGYAQHIRTPQVYFELRVFELAGELVLNVAVVEDLFGAGLVDSVFLDVVTRVRELAAGRGWDEHVGLSGAVATATATVENRGGLEAGAPAGPAEQTIARLWTDLLGLSAVDRSDDFFALGGDSLLAVRMLGRLPGPPVPPREFLADPTVAGLARALRADDAVAVPLRQGTGTPLFLLHPSGGDVLCYTDLTRRLDVPNPVVALTDPGLVDGAGPEGIPEMVRRYLRVVRNHQPHGPYLLGGWSMGGTVGHELARALRADGEEVALLLMIDANSPERIVALEGLDADESEEETRLRYLRSVELFLGFDYGDGLAADALRQRLEADGLTLDGRRFEVFARHLRGLAGHHAGPLDATVPVLLLRAGVVSPRNSRIGMGVDDSFDEPDLGWRPYVEGELTVEEVDAHHYTILHDPAVAVVAARISAALEKTGL